MTGTPSRAKDYLFFIVFFLVDLFAALEVQVEEWAEAFTYHPFFIVGALILVPLLTLTLFLRLFDAKGERVMAES